MSEIFISYKSERRLAAEHFAEVLKRYGYEVWFDYQLVKGHDFTQQIERKVRAAKALVVLWCSRSVSSRWVREEVYLADKLGILIPVMIEPCEIPFGFQLADTIDLTQWDGAPRSHQLDPLIDALEGRIGREAAQDRRGLIEYEATWRRFGAPALRSFALGQPIETDRDRDRLPPVSMPVEAQSAKLPVRATAQPQLTYEDKAQRLIRTFTGHTGGVTSVAISPDGRTALSGSGLIRGSAEVKLWDIASGRRLRNFTGHAGPVRSVTISPDGRAALLSSRTLKLWDIASGRELRSFTGHTGHIRSVAFSPDGRTALSGSFDKTLKLWDIASGRELRTFTGHTDQVYSVVISPDGRTALSSSLKGMKLWDIASGRELRSFTGHTSYVASAAFSPDGHMALSGSGDNTLKLWDIASGRELRSFTGHTGHIRSVAFSPDGRTALSGSADKTLKLWDISEWTQRP
jgi:predicted NACHT family NTPase